MLIQVESRRKPEELIERLRTACAAEGYGVVGIHDLRAGLREQGQSFDRPCLVFEVSRPDQSRTVLERAPEASALLPCRIAVTEDAEGRTVLSTVRPRDLFGTVGAAGLDRAAEDAERSLRSILNAAA
jgi:uncharacterized protein (DUF302 family)